MSCLIANDFMERNYHTSSQLFNFTGQLACQIKLTHNFKSSSAILGILLYKEEYLLYSSTSQHCQWFDDFHGVNKQLTTSKFIIACLNAKMNFL